MKIITKYYDNNLKLRTLKNKTKSNFSLIRFKILKNGKESPCCDFEGKCTNIAYAEVYQFMLKQNKKKGWSYLYKKNYYREEKGYKWKLPACLKVEW